MCDDARVQGLMYGDDDDVVDDTCIGKSGTQYVLLILGQIYADDTEVDGLAADNDESQFEVAAVVVGGGS